MKENAQTAADRKAVRELGGQVRLLGMIFTGVAAYNALHNLPAEKSQMITSAALVTLGVHIMGRMARDCYNAADYARDPIATARHSLKHPPFLSNMLMFMAASFGLGMISDPVKEPAQTEATAAATDPLAGAAATGRSFKGMEIIEDPTCARGSSIMKFDDRKGRSTITECTGP